MGIIYEEKVSGATQDRAELQMNIQRKKIRSGTQSYL